MAIEGYLTVEEAAVRLGVSGGRVRQFISENRLASEKVANLRLIRIDVVEAFKANPSGRPRDESPSKAALAARKSREKK